MKRFHYAWVICAACVLQMICTGGLFVNVLSFTLTFIQQTGVTEAQGSMILSVRCMFTLLSVWFAPVYYNKLSLRSGIFAALLLSSAACVINSFGGSAIVYDIGAAVGGIAYGLGGMVPASMMINRWFQKRRGLAIGVCMAGSGLATVAFPPLITTLVSRGSLRTAFLSEAAFALFSAFLIAAVMRSSPEEKGLLPYGEGESESNSKKKTATPLPGGNLSPLGWGAMLLGLALLGGVGTAAPGHMSVLQTDSGYSAERAALTASIFGFVLTFGKFFFGLMADILGSKRTSCAALAVQSVGCLTALCMNGTDLWPTLTMALFFGLGFPSASVGMSLWASEMSTRQTYAGTLKWFNIAYNLGGILISPLPGLLYGWLQQYQISYLFLAAATILGLSGLLIAYRSVRPVSSILPQQEI